MTSLIKCNNGSFNQKNLPMFLPLVKFKMVIKYNVNLRSDGVFLVQKVAVEEREEKRMSSFFSLSLSSATAFCTKKTQKKTCLIAG